MSDITVTVTDNPITIETTEEAVDVTVSADEPILVSVVSVGEKGEPGISAGRIFYLAQSIDSDVAGYKKALTAPSSGAENTIETACTGTDDILIAQFMTEPGQPGVTSIPEGLARRRFVVLTAADNQYARLKVEMLICDENGDNERLVRSGYSNNFNNSEAAEISWTYSAATPETLELTDREIIRVYVARVAGPATATVTVYFEGANNAAHVQTTISVGLNGCGVPAGGLTGMVLMKKSDDDYDVEWALLPS